MTFNNRVIIMMTVIINQSLVDAIISPVVISQPTIQSGQWTNCIQNCTAYLNTQHNAYGYFFFNITFATAFKEIPQVGVILTNLDDTKIGNNIYGIPLYMTPTGFTLQIGYFNTSIPITLNSLAFSWIAITSKKVFIISQVYSNASSFSYPSSLNPQNTSNLKQFLFIRGGFNKQGCNATSSLDTTKSLVVIDFKGWVPVSPLIDVGITIIVINTEKSSDQRSYTRALSGLTQQTNLNFQDINTIPVQAGQQQNMIIGLQQYYNPNSYWTFNLTKTQQNTSLIGYSFNLEPTSTLTIQYLQLEILNCTVPNSKFDQDNCVCSDSYFEIQSLCQTCDITCQTCMTTATDCQTCNTTNYRSIENNKCPCVDGYYEQSNQALCQICDITCQTCMTTATNCQTCNTTYYRSIQNNKCPCVDGYYEQSNQALCQKCHLSCTKCEGPDSDQCTGCDIHRKLLNGQCLCLQGSYQDSKYVCQDCHYTCQECTGPYENQCKTCKNSIKRFIKSSMCICEQGYYSILNATICQQCHQRCRTCDGGNKFNCLTCFDEQFRQITDNQCICSNGYFQQQDQNICLTCSSVCLKCPIINDTKSIYQDKNCVCDLSCIKHQDTIKLLGDAYNFTQKNDTIGLITRIIEPFGFFSIILRTRQMVLTTLVLETQKANNVFMLQRMLSLFIFKATLSPDQMQGNLTVIKVFNYMDVTNKSMIYQNNPFLRLLGLSELIIYNSLPQLSILGAILILFLLLKCFEFKYRGHPYENKTQKVQMLLIGLVHIIIEGSLLFLFTQILLNFKSLATDKPIHLQGIEFIASFIVSLFIFTFYLGYLIKTFVDIDNHMKKKNALTDGEQRLIEFQFKDEQFIMDYKFYLQQNPMKTRPQAVFTVMSQFKKIVFCLIIVYGQGLIEIQLLSFFLLGTVFLIYAMITAPKKNKIIGMFDLLIQTAFLIYIVSSFIDYRELQSKTDTSKSGEMTVTIIIIIMSLDLLKILYTIISAIIVWQEERKIKQHQEQLMKNSAQNDLNQERHDICSDYSFSYTQQIIPTSCKLNVMPLSVGTGQQPNSFNHPKGSEICGPIINKQR